MSQFYTQSSGGSGPVPPNVPTSFKTDQKSDATPDGTVVPVANTVRLYGNPLVFGTQGILTQAVQTIVPNDTVYIKYVDGELTTTDDTETLINKGEILNESSFTIVGIFTAFEPSTGKAFGGRLMVFGSSFGGVVTIAGELENLSAGASPLDLCSFSAQASGSNLNFVVKGLVGHTLNWHALFPNIAST